MGRKVFQGAVDGLTADVKRVISVTRKVVRGLSPIVVIRKVKNRNGTKARLGEQLLRVIWVTEPVLGQDRIPKG